MQALRGLLTKHETFCLDPEGWGPYSHVRPTDLTPCFETGVALAIPHAVLAVFGPVLIATLHRRERIIRDDWSNILLVWKMCLLAAAFLASIAHLVTAIIASRDPLRDQYPYASTLFTISAVISIPLAYLTHTRTRRASDLLLGCWTASFIASVLRIRTAILVDDFADPTQLTLFITYIIFTTFFILAFCAESLGPECKPPNKTGRIRLEDAVAPNNMGENPAVTANLFSRITFSYMTPLMRLGASRHLEEEDIYALAPEDHSDKISQTLEANWRQAQTKAKTGSSLNSKKKSSLFVALLWSYGKPYAVAGVYRIASDIFTFFQPQLLRMLLQFVASYKIGDAQGTKTPDPPIHGVIIACAMLVAGLLQTALFHQYFDRVFATGMRVKVGIITLLYNKSLVISNGERSGRATGDIVNLQSVDAFRMGDLTLYALMVVSAPFQIIAAFVSLWFLLGWSAFAGVFFMVLSLPLNMLLARYQERLEVEQMKIKDHRTRLMSEILSNMRSIKLYAWEPTFTQKILEVRHNHELRLTRKIGIVYAVNNWFMCTIPIVVAFTTFAAYAYTSKHALTSDIIFPAISLFQLLQFPLAVLPNVISAVVESVVSEARLVNFLEAAELQQDARFVILPGVDEPPHQLHDELICIQNGVFHWNEDSERILDDIIFSARKGELVAICGRVGAGKSSLLAAILGEMTRTQGEVIVRGSVAYSAQQPVVLSATVKDNILFGHSFDEEFYNRVLDACALRQDLEIFAQGDNTEIGEKGVSLSGGQRARIALARAVYARADIYVLDDPLSAVDAHVAAHLFNNVIGPQGLLRSKCRVLCTNSVAFLPETDQLVMLRNGRIVDKATHIEVMSQRDGPLFSLISGLGNRSSRSSPDNLSNIPPLEQQPGTDSTSPILAHTQRKQRNRRSIASFDDARLLSLDENKELALQDLKDTARLQEISEQGRVKIQVYKDYIAAAAPIAVAIFGIATIGSQALSISSNMILRSWTNENLDVGETSRVGYYLSIYGMAGLLSSLLEFASSFTIWVYCAIRSARRLHDAAFSSIMRSPMSFFETTPQGRIMNLFSRDIYVIDELLAMMIDGFLTSVASVLGVLFIISLGAPVILLAVIPLFFIYKSMMRYYLATSRELKRYDATSRAPIFSWFGETLASLSTIRAYGQQARFIANNEARIDRNQKCYFPSVSVNRWVGVRLELIGSLILFAAALASVWALTNARAVDAGLVGLMLSYAVTVTKSLNGVVRCASEVENNIVSVERVIGYENLPHEAAAEIEERRPPVEWPQEGRVVFKHYSAQYRPELDFCLKDISLDIRPGEKIGVCGRTGAGKSSLALALFRIIEAVGGCIVIDDIDISDIGLHDLRSAISIIPQDPQLFEGTIRDNVDPVSEHSDAEIWDALYQAHLKPHIESMTGGLSAAIVEGGQNMSSGQRQLVCFARALLRRSKVLVLDEATSALDLQTDTAMQDILGGSDFRNTTTITIAHRLDTIIHSDRVIVMDEGQVVEFDSPEALLSQPQTVFSALCESAGLGMDSMKVQHRVS